MNGRTHATLRKAVRSKGSNGYGVDGGGGGGGGEGSVLRKLTNGF
jgi:hypothetical protein